MDLRYVNSRGVELNLTQWPYMYSILVTFMILCGLTRWRQEILIELLSFIKHL